MSSVEAFVCSLYCQPKLTDVNEVRYKIFCPNFRDALQLRVNCASYQAAAWRSALVDIQRFQVIMVMDGLLIPLLLNKILLYKHQVDQIISRSTAAPKVDLLFLQDRLQVPPVLMH